MIIVLFLFLLLSFAKKLQLPAIFKQNSYFIDKIKEYYYKRDYMIEQLHNIRSSLIKIMYGFLDVLMKIIFTVNVVCVNVFSKLDVNFYLPLCRSSIKLIFMYFMTEYRIVERHNVVLYLLLNYCNYFLVLRKKHHFKWTINFHCVPWGFDEYNMNNFFSIQNFFNIQLTSVLQCNIFINYLFDFNKINKNSN